MTPSETMTFTDIRVADIVLFSTVLLLWFVNLLMLGFKHRFQNRLITVILYGIIGLIVFARLIEVIYITMYANSLTLSPIIFITGAIATYAKIALGCCQLSAMFEIRA